jgi:hypothetical protein
LFMFQIWSIFFLLPFVYLKKKLISFPFNFFHLSYVVFILLIAICYIWNIF